MIRRLIKNIRRQPKHARDRIALGIASTFTAAVFSIWAYSMPDRISSIVVEHEKEDSPAFSQFFDQIGSQLSSVRESDTENNDPETPQNNNMEKKAQSEQDIVDEGRAFSDKTSSSSVITQEDFVIGGRPNTPGTMGSTSQSTSSAPRAIRLVSESQSTSSVGTE